MRHHQQPVSRAAIGVAKRLTNPADSAAFEARFGTTPVWFITVSPAALEKVPNNKERPHLSFAVSRSRGGQCNVLLVVQFDELQVRVVVGRDNPLFVDVVEGALESGVLRLVFGTDAGDSSNILSCAADLGDLCTLIDHFEAPPGLSLQRRIRDLTFAAANCRSIDELPSLIPDVEIERVEVALVTDGEDWQDEVLVEPAQVTKQQIPGRDGVDGAMLH